MKKLTQLLFVLLCTALLFAACVGDTPNTTADPALSASTAPTEPPTDPTEPPTDPTEPPTDPPTEPTELIIPLPTVPGNPLEYQPGSIKLTKQSSDDYDFERQYRLLYYRIDYAFFDLLTEDQNNEFSEWLWENAKNTNYGEFRNEMALVTLVKRYNIPREAFDKVVEEMVAMDVKLNKNFMTEEHEVPNADVIYTFDNEIINNYYRYE